jgi:ABC-type dipeptide/oligopeptide/nickel transport system ATPase component
MRLDDSCSFRPRCSFAVDRCAKAPQLETAGAEGHVAACWQAQKVAASLRQAS